MTTAGEKRDSSVVAAVPDDKRRRSRHTLSSGTTAARQRATAPESWPVNGLGLQREEFSLTSTCGGGACQDSAEALDTAGPSDRGVAPRMICGRTPGTAVGAGVQ